jgi:hypothetical protein
MKNLGCALVVVATVACGGSGSPQPTAPTEAAHAPAIVALQTYLVGSMSSYVDFFLIDVDGDPIRWAATVTTAPGCPRCTPGPLGLAYVDEQFVRTGGAPSGTVASGTRLRLSYRPGSGPEPNYVHVTITASDSSGASTSATIELWNF